VKLSLIAICEQVWAANDELSRAPELSNYSKSTSRAKPQHTWSALCA